MWVLDAVSNEEESPAKREETLKQSVKNRLGTAKLTNIVIENATDLTSKLSAHLGPVL